MGSYDTVLCTNEPQAAGYPEGVCDALAKEGTCPHPHPRLCVLPPSLRKCMLLGRGARGTMCIVQCAVCIAWRGGACSRVENRVRHVLGFLVLGFALAGVILY